jgi:FkbM family methyltransferase
MKPKRTEHHGGNTAIASQRPTRAWAYCCVGLSVGFVLGGQRQCLSVQPVGRIMSLRNDSGGESAPGATPWWEPIVNANRAKTDGLRVYKSPVRFEHPVDNGFRLMQLLELLGVDPATNPRASPSTIIAIGLRTESLWFARAGYHVHAFEARQEGCKLVSERLTKLIPSMRSQVQLHLTALSNYAGTTDIYDANDSSSLLRGAVINGRREKRKFTGRVETVPVTTLDLVFRSLDPKLATSVVGMQVDTQGVEPEIFMGAQSILENPATRPRVIVTEYTSRFRKFEELSVGLHLLIGLGYTCYYDQGKESTLGESTVISPTNEFDGDFYCTIVPLESFVEATKTSRKMKV